MGAEVKVIEEIVLCILGTIKNLADPSAGALNAVLDALIKPPDEIRAALASVIARLDSIGGHIPEDINSFNVKLAELRRVLMQNGIDESAVAKIRDAIGYFNASAQRRIGKHGDLQKMLSAKPIIEETVMRFMADLTADCQNAKSALEEFEAYLAESNEKIEAMLRQNKTFSIDIGAHALKMGINMKETIVIIDADFAHHLAEQQRRNGKEYFAMGIPGRVILPEKVYEDMTRNPRFHPERSLVPPQVLGYIKGVLKANVVKVQRTEQLVQEVINVWENTAAVHKPASAQRMRESGDMDIMLFLLQHPRGLIVVLSDDSDIRLMVWGFRRQQKMTNVAVIRNENNGLTRVA